MGLTAFPTLLLALAQAILSPLGSVLLTSEPLDIGYRQMYDLQFQDAHRTFQAYEQTHPDDAMGPTSRAAAYLFAEFERLGVLQTELFVNDDLFAGRKKPEPDPEIRAAFMQSLERSGRRAAAVLARAPRDRNALLARVLNQGLEADYLALVEKRNMAAVSRAKKAGQLAEDLLRVAPDCYDAYLAIGVENYLLSLKPAPVRWFLRLYGAQTNREAGLRNLELTAERGRYLLPYARLMLAVAALRDNDRGRAKDLLADLAREFPNNTLYRQELAKLR
jgi:hypothetical protein